MRKIFTKILCCTVAAAAAVGVLSVSACGNVSKDNLSDYKTGGTISSNGGFAVEQGDFVYFINGKEANTADNTHGSVVKGAVMRISKDSLKNHNYSDVKTVVPQIVYSGNRNAGIFVYGDYIYYATPSTEKNSDGEVQNSHLAFKRTKLDGTETMKDKYFVQSPDNSVEYRYVEAGGKVYLMYVATNEDLYGTSCTNIHSYSVETGVNSLLAYNVDSYVFDSTDLTDPRVYYTMKVPDLALGTTSSNYNQIWTVAADEVTPNEYDFSAVEDYDAKEDPVYVNCGKLVFDGIGKVEGMTQSYTQFNSKEEGLLNSNGELTVDRSAYTYTLSSYQNGTLFYTRTSTENDSAMLFAANQSDLLSASWKPVAGNPKNEQCLIRDGSAVSSYTYLFKDGKLDEVLILNSTGILKAKVEDGKLLTDIDNEKTFYMTNGGQATLLCLDEASDYIYYSLSGGNGYTVNRIKYDGRYNDYNGLAVVDEVTEYTSVRILDLDCASDWYLPEMIEGQILFPAQTDHMTDFVYIMACDLRGTSGAVMSNDEIDKLNDLYEGIEDEIEKIDDTVYENLKSALHYAHFTNDGEYIRTLIKAYKDILGYDEEHFWSNKSLEKYDEFLAASKDDETWGDYSATVKVNGKEVAANKRDYYYALLGEMNDEDAEAYEELLKTTYLQEYPEKEGTWFEKLSTGAKAGFIIGVVLGGLIVIAAAVIIPLVIIKKRKKKMPVYKKKRIRVDTTDDKNIDVYSDEGNSSDGSEE